MYLFQFSCSFYIFELIELSQNSSIRNLVLGKKKKTRENREKIGRARKKIIILYLCKKLKCNYTNLEKLTYNNRRVNTVNTLNMVAKDLDKDEMKVTQDA